MKIVLFAFLLTFLSVDALSQITSPESIIWNEYTETYIISDAGAGKLLSMDKSGAVGDFTTGLNQPKGLVMGNFSLWVTDVTEIVEIDPITGEIGSAQVFLRFQRNSCAWVRLLNVGSTELSPISGILAHL